MGKLRYRDVRWFVQGLPAIVCQSWEWKSYLLGPNPMFCPLGNLPPQKSRGSALFLLGSVRMLSGIFRLLSVRASSSRPSADPPIYSLCQDLWEFLSKQPVSPFLGSYAGRILFDLGLGLFEPLCTAPAFLPNIKELEFRWEFLCIAC